ncbi:MAG: SDR family NAD(P)-dependent oxidoreductase [Gammaproteobacteria bacterium]|nr:SDR family NAD(P)-dependent oxidoreductase [Gammaproteobacteria bacterium]
MSDSWRSAWITGASQGIGRALAIALADAGVRVAASARSAGELYRLESEHPPITSHPLDVTDPEMTADALDTIESTQGHVDLAVLGAGIYEPIPGGIAEPSVFRRHMEINYLGVVNVLMPLLARMKTRGTGQVAIVASVAGYRGLPKAAAYGPTKAALINLAEILRTEFSGSGVDIRLVNPGFVSTRLTAKNDFSMPAIMTPEQAASRIIRGLQGTGFEIAFPRRFVAWLKIARVLPYRLWLPLARRMVG